MDSEFFDECPHFGRQFSNLFLHARDLEDTIQQTLVEVLAWYLTLMVRGENISEDVGCYSVGVDLFNYSVEVGGMRGIRKSWDGEVCDAGQDLGMRCFRFVLDGCKELCRSGRRLWSHCGKCMQSARQAGTWACQSPGDGGSSGGTRCREG